MGKKVLVTGGAGFIGSHLADYLLAEGHEVTVLDDLSGGKRENVPQKAEFIQGSIVDPAIADRAVQGKDVIYHLAAYAAEGLSHFVKRFNLMNNAVGSINLINSAIKHNVPRFLFTSSMAVYGSGNPPFDETHRQNPEDSYGIAKFSVEQELHCSHEMFGLDFVIIRPHNVYGERQFLGDPYRNVIGIWMNRIMQGKPPLIYGDGEQTRAFSYIQDIVPCIARAPFAEGAKNQIINLGSAHSYTLNQLAEMVTVAMGTNIMPQHVQPRKEVKHAYCTTKKSEELLGFEDRTPLKDGLANMAAWAKTVGPMDPIVWESYELTKGLPSFWVNLATDFPNAKQRVNPKFF
jgi:UDP-glucose 4-epimerase